MTSWKTRKWRVPAVGQTKYPEYVPTWDWRNGSSMVSQKLGSWSIDPSLCEVLFNEVTETLELNIRGVSVTGEERCCGKPPTCHHFCKRQNEFSKVLHVVSYWPGDLSPVPAGDIMLFPLFASSVSLHFPIQTVIIFFQFFNSCIFLNYECMPGKSIKSHYRWLWITMWLLKIELRNSVRSVSALFCWAS